MEIKTPAMLLCFDDWHIDEWHNYLQFFDDHNMKATFYVSGIASIRLVDHGWDKLRELQAHGHTIGHHGMNHLRAGNMIEQEGCETFMAREIWTGLEIFKKESFDNIQHYCYPYGNRTEASDNCLLQTFRTLRYGGRKFYIADELKKERTIASKHFGKHVDIMPCGYEPLIEITIRNNAVLCGYMHQPMPKRLEWLGNLKQLHFLPMSVLDVSEVQND